MVHFEELTTGAGRTIALCGRFQKAGKHSTIQGRFAKDDLKDLKVTFKDHKEWRDVDFLVAGNPPGDTPAEAQNAGKVVLNESWIAEISKAKKWVVPTESHKWILGPTDSAGHEPSTDNGNEHASAQQGGNPQKPSNEQVSNTSTAVNDQGKSPVPTVTGKRKDIHIPDNTSSPNVQTNNRQSDISIQDADANNLADQNSSALDAQDSGSGGGGAAADTTGKRSSNQTMPDADNDANDSARGQADNAQPEKSGGTATAQKNAGASTTGAASVTSGPSAAVPSISMNPSESGVSVSEAIVQSREGTGEPNTAPQSGTNANESNRTATWVNNAGIHQSAASDTRYSPSPEPQSANQTGADSTPLDGNGEYDQAPLANPLLSKWRVDWVPDCNKIPFIHPETHKNCEVIILGSLEDKPSLIAVHVDGPRNDHLPITRHVFVLPKSKHAATYQSYKAQGNKRIIGRGNPDTDLGAELAKFVYLGIATQGRNTYCIGIPDGNPDLEPLYFTRTEMKAKYGKAADEHINQIRNGLGLPLIGKGANPKKLHPLPKTGMQRTRLQT